MLAWDPNAHERHRAGQPLGDMLGGTEDILSGSSLPDLNPQSPYMPTAAIAATSTSKRPSVFDNIGQIFYEQGKGLVEEYGPPPVVTYPTGNSRGGVVENKTPASSDDDILSKPAAPPVIAAPPVVNMQPVSIGPGRNVAPPQLAYADDSDNMMMGIPTTYLVIGGALLLGALLISK